jgi:hypothetical protein
MIDFFLGEQPFVRLILERDFSQAAKKNHEFLGIIRIFQEFLEFSSIFGSFGNFEKRRNKRSLRSFEKYQV